MVFLFFCLLIFNHPATFCLLKLILQLVAWLKGACVKWNLIWSASLFTLNWVIWTQTRHGSSQQEYGRGIVHMESIVALYGPTTIFQYGCWSNKKTISSYYPTREPNTLPFSHPTWSRTTGRTQPWEQLPANSHQPAQAPCTLNSSHKEGSWFKLSSIYFFVYVMLCMVRSWAEPKGGPHGPWRHSNLKNKRITHKF